MKRMVRGLAAQDFYGEELEGEGGEIHMGGSGFNLDKVLVFDRDSRRIRLTNRELLPEDDIAFRFARILEECGVSYVVVASYIAILFGRARRSDDVDFILERIDEDKFVELCRRALGGGFSLMQGDIASENLVRTLYRIYLVEGYSVRFMYRDVVIPNIEVKMAKTNVHRYALEHSLLVEVNDRFTIRISPLELQIAYKLYLGAEKDVGDAVFLYTLFRDSINHDELGKWCREIGVDCSILEGV